MDWAESLKGGLILQKEEFDALFLKEISRDNFWELAQFYQQKIVEKGKF